MENKQEAIEKAFEKKARKLYTARQKFDVLLKLCAEHGAAAADLVALERKLVYSNNYYR